MTHNRDTHHEAEVTARRHDETDVPVGPHSEITATTPASGQQSVGQQFDALERVTELNDVIRRVNAAVASSTARDELTQTVCERLADSSLYRAACMIDRPTWIGIGDNWTVAGDPPDNEQTPTLLEDGVEGLPDGATVCEGDWTVVPITHDGTVYGALGVCLSRPTVSDRERGVLGELGTIIGHAVAAIESRRHVADGTAVELELASDDAADPLISAARQVGCRFKLAGLVPAGREERVAYFWVEGASPAAATDAIETAGDEGVEPIRADDDGAGGLLEWAGQHSGVLGAIVDHGTNITGATIDSDSASYTVEIASDTVARSLLDRVERAGPETRLEAKRDVERAANTPSSFPRQSVEELTDRQRDVLEVAYRAGYFRWPRDSTAEEIAETLDISAPTLHAHLRKALGGLLTELFDGLDTGRSTDTESTR